MSICSTSVGQFPAQGELVSIGVIEEGFISLNHPDIAPYIDRSQMGTIRWVDSNGKQTDLLTLSEPPQFQTQEAVWTERKAWSDYINDKIKSSKGKSILEKSKLALQIGFRWLKYEKTPWIKAQLAPNLDNMHGTHVAGILVEGLKNVRLIVLPRPIEYYSVEISNSDSLAKIVQRLQQNTMDYYEQLGNVIRESNIRVINISLQLIANEKRNEEFLHSLQDEMRHKVANEDITKSARILSDFEEFQFRKLVRANPETVFVVTAGNNGQRISRDQPQVAIKEPNYVRVTSVGKGQNISSFSNWSETDIDIAAIGESVESSLLGGGKIKLSGTSFAAPKVANRLTHILVETPHIKIQEAVSSLYAEHATPYSSLNKFVNGGHALNEHPIGRAKSISCKNIFGY